MRGGFRPENPTGNYLPANAFLPFDRFPLVSGDAIRALSHPYRESILKVLEEGRTTYSDLFTHLEPNGGDRGRFNYHLRSLRNADLVQLEDSQYRLTDRGKAALILLKGVSEHPEFKTGTGEKSRHGYGGRALIAGSILRTRAGLIGIVGGIVVLASVFLPWGFPVRPWGGGIERWVIGFSAGIGGALTLAFALAGLVAMAIPRRTATALAGVFGVVALSSAFLTLFAMTIALTPTLLGGLLRVNDAFPPYYTAPWIGLYIGIVGASMLVLGAAWTLRFGRGTVAASAGSEDTDRAAEGETPLDGVDRSLQGGTILRWRRIQARGVLR